MNFSNLRYYCSLITIIVLSNACGFQDLKINSFTIDPVNENVLKYKIAIQTNIEASTKLMYWSKNDTITIKGFGKNTEHEYMVIGLSQKTKYYFMIEAIDSEDQVSVVKELETAELPNVLPIFDLVENKGDVFDGYIVMRKSHDPGMEIAINNEGEIVWYNQYKSKLIRPFDIIDGNSIIGLNDFETIRESDFFGNTKFELKYGEKGFDKKLHHEIIKNAQGDIIALTEEYKSYDLSGIGGSKSDTVRGEGILVLDKEGNKKWHWSVFDVTDPTKSKLLPRLKIDWSHANALKIDTDGNYLISFHHFDQIWKIDSNTGNVLWKLGIDGDFELDSEAKFYKQHAVHINPLGQLMLFDNGDTSRMTSRAISFELDEVNMKAELQLSVFLPDSLFSFKQGSAYIIEKNKILFCSSIKKKTVITDFDGNILWQANSDFSYYRAEYISKFPVYHKEL
jgi:arylsulfate sulfotransferase